MPGARLFRPLCIRPGREAGRRPGQQPQQPLFGGAQGQRLARPPEGRGRKVKDQPVLPVHRGRPGAAPPQQRRHPRPQHRQAEGLGHIVVGPGLQPVDDVHLQVVGGEQQHRHRVPGAQPPHQVQRAAVRQVHIQDQQLKALPGQRGPGRGQGTAGGQADLRCAQRQRDAGTQRFIILHQQDAVHGITLLFLPSIPHPARRVHPRGRPAQISPPGHLVYFPALRYTNTVYLDVCPSVRGGAGSPAGAAGGVPSRITTPGGGNLGKTHLHP